MEQQQSALQYWLPVLSFLHFLDFIYGGVYGFCFDLFLSMVLSLFFFEQNSCIVLCFAVVICMV